MFLEANGGKEIKMSLPNYGQYRKTSKGSDLAVRYVPENAVIMPVGELASE